MKELTLRAPRRAVTLIAASGLALGGVAALATGWSASASPEHPHQVWVCKYVQKPDSDEVLKGGKQPIFVDWASLSGNGTEPQVGDMFKDGQTLSVVVQIGGENPGAGACKDLEPPKTPPTTMPPATTTMPPATTTMPPVTTTMPPKTTTMPPVTTTMPPKTVTANGGGGIGGGTGGGAGGTGGGTGGTGGGTGMGGGVTQMTPGVGAPHTGGDGDSSSGNRLLGSGLLASGLALAAGEAARRRRENATR